MEPPQPTSDATPAKRAVVTGAASGIGRATTERLVEEGVEVIAVDLNEEGLSTLEGPMTKPVVADLGRAADLERIADAAGESVDYLVNAAGIHCLKRISDFTREDWARVFAVNAESVFFLCQALEPRIPSGGAIVNVSSIAAKLASSGEAAVYAASKAAVASLTRSFAFELSERNVRVNAVFPGLIDTPMQDEAMAAYSSLRGMTLEEWSDMQIARLPMKRAGTAAEVAATIWFLLSPESSYMTGQSVNVTGGILTW